MGTGGNGGCRKRQVRKPVSSAGVTALWTPVGVTECGTSWAILEGDATVKRGLSACSEVTGRDVGRDISVFVGVA